MKIPHPDDPSPSEFDAPPPAPIGGKMMPAAQMEKLVARPARAGVNNPSAKATAARMPEYHAPPPASARRR